MAKTREWICPICNSNHTTEMSSGFEDMCAYSHMRCDKCGAEWDDNFSVEYCGYNLFNEYGQLVIFDAQGEEV